MRIASDFGVVLAVLRLLSRGLIAHRLIRLIAHRHRSTNVLINARSFLGTNVLKIARRLSGIPSQTGVIFRIEE